MLTGEFRHTLDQKNRIFVPAKLREELGETFMVACSLRDKCLKVYSMEGWEAYIAPIKQQRRELAESVMRLLHHNAAQVTPDAQGRILLPASLIAFAQIEKSAVIVGCSDYAEIWAEDQYDAVINSVDLDALRKALEECGL